MPQNDQVLPVLGKQMNRPPRIDEELMPVSRFVTVPPTGQTGTKANCTLTFEAPVTDPDVGDTTHYRFYIDWNPTTGYFPAVADQVPAGNPALISFTTVVGSSSPLYSTGPHLVELWVTDGPADNYTSRKAAPYPPDLPDGGTLEQYYIATYAWVVNNTGGCPP